MENLVNYSLLLQKMLKEAAKEINFEYDFGVYDLVAMNIFNDYEIDIDRNNEGSADWKMMMILSDSVREWQEETVKNHQ